MNASHNLAVTDHAPLCEPANRFLADYERISALSGEEFCVAAFTAIEQFEEETRAASEPYHQLQAEEMREAFERICQGSALLLEHQARLYSGIGKRGGAGALSPKWKRFREQATRFLAEADRIRVLAGEDFKRESATAIGAFTSLNDMNALKAEIYADWAATPLRRRLSRPVEK